MKGKLMSDANFIRLPALEIKQGANRLLYSFAVDGKLLHEFAAVSRIHRNQSDHIKGYQRPEVQAHINEIRSYIESDGAMIPNALVVAFDDSVTFEPAEVQQIGPAYTRVGTLVVPMGRGAAASDLPGWIVDGQQRAAAIRDAEIAKFPICVVAFITKDAQEQREQFILVNSTKPLPKGLIYELLPNTESKLPSNLQRRRFPAYLVDRLNFDPDSPLKGMIQTPTNPGGVIKDNSMMRMLEQSIAEGALYHLRDKNAGNAQGDAMLTVLKSFWAAVAEVFPDAWNKSPRRSRLMHGAGIICLGLLMDAISDRSGIGDSPSKTEFASDLLPLVPICRWTAGFWEFGVGTQRKWNEIQNTAKDIQLLANFLLYQYRLLVWDLALKQA